MVLCRACYDHEMAYRLQRGLCHAHELPPWVSLKVYDPATALPRPHKRKATGARPRTACHKFGQAVIRLLRAREDYERVPVNVLLELAEESGVSLAKPIEDL